MRFFILFFLTFSIGICTQVQYDFQPLALAPISTFENACARCHGSQGSFYGDAFASLETEKLAKVVKEMMEGPAFLQPTEYEVLAMIDYQKALAEKQPFLVISKVHTLNQQLQIFGETLPNAKLFYVQGGKTQSIEINENGDWQLLIKNLEKLKFKVIQNGQEKILNPMEKQWQ